ncbi:MAG: phosphodiester glycosidase family protein [Oscillospiraceae bacterium]|nr:phosphodiester glycosidase family protein [Oscillospiraceae bacterium]
MNMRRGTALALCMALCAALLAAPAAAAPVAVADVGTLHRADRLTLADRTVLTQTTLTHGTAGRQEERYIEWGPGSAVTAMAAGGDAVYGGALTLNDAYRRLTARGIEPVAMINADFFSLETGVPTGLLITEGVLRASDGGQTAVGFPRTGGVFLFKSPVYVNLTARVGTNDRTITVDDVNRLRTRDRLVLYTPDFGANTQTNTAGTHVVLTVNGALSVGGTVTGTVKEVLSGAAPAVLRTGEMVLSADAQGPLVRLEGLTPGAAVSLTVRCSDARLASCDYAVGAYQRLLTNGQPASGLETGAAPRTAVGIKADGTCVFYTVDGRQENYSLGLSLPELARRLLSLGCVDAVNLDGGGSTILAARYPGQSELTVTGRPSDGAQRRVADFIVLANQTPAQNAAERIFVYPDGAVLLQNAQLAYKGYATDANYHPVSAPALTWWSDNNTVGTLDAGGTFTAHAPGDVSVAATAGGVSGGAVVRVVSALDSLTLVNEQTNQTVTALAVMPGESVRLTAVGLVDTLPVVSQDSCFVWDVVGRIGAVDAEGTFTASDTIGVTGYLVALRGGNTVSIPVTVGQLPQTVENFEEASGRLSEGDDKISFAYETEVENVRYGRRAGRLSYDFTGLPLGQTLTLPVDLPLSGSPAHLNLWISGDESGNILSVKVEGASGGVTDLTVQTLDFTGYRYTQVLLPDGAARVTGVSILRAGSGALSGTILTDQWVASHHRYEDNLPPKMTVEKADATSQPGRIVFEAVVTDDTGAILRREDITLRLDGVLVSFTHDELTGRVTAYLPLDDIHPHRLTLEAVDPAGNRDRRSFDLSTLPEGLPPDLRFADVELTHWARRDIAFLDNRGVLTAEERDGRFYYAPGLALTRADMAVYIARMLGVDLGRYDSVTLPFTDTDEIPAAALREVRALYALGVVRGKTQDGRLFYDPAASISRAEFCTIIGRTLARGYVKMPSVFGDRDQIPAYAKEHIDTLLSLGVIAGYPDNTMRPTGDITRAEAAKVLSRLY